MLPALESTGLKVGEDFFLAFSPERVDPGNPTLRHPEHAEGGRRHHRRTAAGWPWRSTSRPSTPWCPVSTTEAAELVKLLENTFRSVNIGLVNEMAIVCDKLGVDVWEVIEAAATKPFGFMKFLPGPGLGGHCIPLDPALPRLEDARRSTTRRASSTWPARSTPRCRCSGSRKVADALNDQGKAVEGRRVLVLGVAYKRDIDDIRESPALDIIRLLEGQGARVTYSRSPRADASARTGTSSGRWR